MLSLMYLILFLALSAALTWWRVTAYQRHHLQPLPVKKNDMRSLAQQRRR